MNNACLHPQDRPVTIQLSEQQLKSFSGLSGAGAGAETVLPFVQEPDAHVETIWVKVGEAPLRIYKNEYDKTPPVLMFPLSSCGR